MTYATVADLVTRFGEAELIDLTDRADPPAGVVDTAVADGAIADAVGEIDTYLGVRYALPVSPLPALLVMVTCDIARYRLHGTRVTDEVRARYDDALRWLKDVALGRALLPGATAAANGTTTAALAEVVQAGRKVFGGGLQ
ncbi:Mu-like prophage protein gp36 [Aromatoleum tolulyticum]|uniref:Mu-like prophage protein gp36 n=1 Tax=Aromatoleum tolulyticum TaxID=34027 RepID=A0A1N6X252_9RHOO|nr:DUF1320 domain-containing protein [Aromatoleum tolulyticum]SIQ96422.1 Mu-like prophage protein gp36 [Aromatoleum tolulyticum]